MDRNMPGLPVYHQLPESTETHFHWVGDAIQPSLPLSSPSPALNLSQHQDFFKWVSSLPSGGQSIGVSASTSVLPMNTQDWCPLGWTGWISLQSKGLSKSLLQHHSSKASINSYYLVDNHSYYLIELHIYFIFIIFFSIFTFSILKIYFCSWGKILFYSSYL